MPSGSCMCGALRYEITSVPSAKIACHCLPCRKTAGPTGSVNFLVPEEGFRITSGTPKQWSRKGDSGKDVTYDFCSTCGVYTSASAINYPGTIIVKPGTLDDDVTVRNTKPTTEIYVKHRVDWCPSVPEADQTEGPL
ncbi:hypothetical protein EV356DRAFT_516930 [Viridothelium virens]|uniref:CENP-V/GFA domain-containing protein n=1 Tax=Viridothelium virens TaxID=1048519 RepID=A0A6A6H4H7_VIRVR|nr:hypothetical protein EV356DRAFT_516930 [Viridothelium virens]